MPHRTAINTMSTANLLVSTCIYFQTRGCEFDWLLATQCFVNGKALAVSSISVTSRSFDPKPGAIASLNAITARGQWLEDTHIDHVQALLSISHPVVDGHSH